jgi:hypothetical protein
MKSSMPGSSVWNYLFHSRAPLKDDFKTRDKKDSPQTLILSELQNSCG